MDTSNSITFNYIDNLLCYGFFSANKPGVAVDLKSVIGFIDYIDHSIMTYDEMATSLAKLLQTGLVIRINESYCTTDRFNKAWLEKLSANKKKSISKELKELQEFLNTHFTPVVINDIHPDLIISPNEFKAAVDAYLGNTVS